MSGSSGLNLTQKNLYTKPINRKKTLVVVNLETVRISGVVSEGMILAATNNACGRQIIFVDEIIPEGTRVL